MKIIGEITRPLQEKTGPQVVAVNAVARPLARRQEATPEDLLAAWLDRRSDHTRRAYQADLSNFASWLHVPGPAGALALLVTSTQADANLRVFNYCSDLRRAGKSPATINRHLAAITSVLKLARSLGMTSISVEVPREKNQPYRDTTGPSLKKIRSIIANLERRAPEDVKAIRDLAIVRLLFNNGLRCHEVVGTDLAHYDRRARRLSILGKGRTQREWVTLSPKASTALRAWVEVRGTEPGPLFVSVFKNQNMTAGRILPGLRRICREDIFRMCQKFGIRPHGLRHSAISEALRRTRGDIARVQQFSRHASPVTVMIYNDHLRDDAAGVAKALDGAA